MAVILDPIDHLEMPTLYCEQCGEPIVDHSTGLFAWSPPAPPKSGYLESHFLHQACAAAFEENRGTELPWQFLSTLWRRSIERRSDEESAAEKEPA